MKRVPVPSLATLIAINCAVVVVSATAGWLVCTSRWMAGQGSFHSEWRGPMEILPLAVRLGSANLHAVALMLLGSVTAGLYALEAIIINSYGVGELFGNMLHVYGGEAWLLLAYAPIEFLALVLAASASERLSIDVIRHLVFHEPFRLRPLVTVLAAVVGLVAVAAVIEAHLGQRFAYRPLAAQTLEAR